MLQSNLVNKISILVKKKSIHVICYKIIYFVLLFTSCIYKVILSTYVVYDGNAIN